MTIALVASSTAASSGANSVTTTAIDTTGANLIVLSVSNSLSTLTISDNKGNTWTALTQHTATVGANTNYTRLYYCLNPTSVGTGHTFTVTGTSSYAGLVAQAFSGVQAFGSEGGLNNATTASGNGGTVTPASDGSLVVAMIGGDGDPTAIDSSFSAPVHHGFIGSTSWGIGAAYLIQPTAGTVNPTWTISSYSGSGYGMSAGIATFTAAAAGAATSYTLTGPSSGTTGSASTNFTVQSNGHLSSSVTITPATSGTGTFTPSTVTLGVGDNTSATFTYTPGASETATISTTNSSTLTNPSSLTYTSSPANTTILPNDASIVYSPYNWNVSSSHAITINSGAYFRLLFTGTSIVLNFNVASMASPASQIWWRVDDGPWTSAAVASTVTPTIPAALLSKSNIPYHLIEVVVKSTTQTANRWNTGVTTTAVDLTSITLDGSASVAAPKKAPRNVLVYGDSICEGVLTLYESAANDTDRNDSTMAAAGLPLGKLLGAEIGVVGFGGQGYVTAGTSATNVPTFPNTYNLLYSGVSRTFSPTPDLVVIEQGTNDGSTNTTTAATGVFNNISTAVGTTVPVAVLRPLNGTAQSTFLTNAIAAATTPSQFHFIDTATFFNATYGVDGGGLHPSGPNALGEVAPQIAGQLKTLLGGGSTGGISRARLQ